MSGITIKIVVGAEYRTRDGSKARTYATDAAGDYPVHGAVWCQHAKAWDVCTWTTDGHAWKGDPRMEDDADLVGIWEEPGP